MNYDDPKRDASSSHELAQILRKLEPRRSHVDVDLICQPLADRASSTAPRPARLSMLTIGCSCVASAVAGAAIVFVVMGVQVSNLKQEIALLGSRKASPLGEIELSVRVNDDARIASVIVEAGQGTAAVASKAYAYPMPRLLPNEFGGNRLAVGSHLQCVAYRHTHDGLSLESDGAIDQAFGASDLRLDQRRRPATRAALLKDLLDS